ncbi:MAG: hypothetical protein ACYDCN_02445 [Bacteroidia bacterium]
MKKTTILLTAILFTVLACKKSSTTTSGGGGGGTTPNTTISNGFPASGTSSINGVLYAQSITIPSYSITQYNGGAAFSKTAKPFSLMYTIYGILIGSDLVGVLKLDSTILKYSTTGNITYTDTTNSSIYSAVKWNIGGNTNFGAFTTTVTRGYPVMTNASYLPTTFSKSQPLTINFGATNYSNTDSIMVMITDNASPTSFGFYKYLAGNASSVTFAASQLSGLSTTSASPEIIVYAKNFSNMTNANKNYIFVMQNSLVQFITITP